MKDRQFSPHNCDSSVQMEDLRLADALVWTTSSVPPELLRHRYDSAQEVTSHERRELATLIQLRVLRLGFRQDGDVRGAFWGILRQLPVQRVDLLGADVADD